MHSPRIRQSMKPAEPDMFSFHPNPVAYLDGVTVGTLAGIPVL